jgi:NAD(P)H dehydrogenase (quinone)
MKTLIVYAHPEPKSLNNSLKDLAVSTLTSIGHEVRVSDLYAMNWKAVVDAADYGPHAHCPLVKGDTRD